MEESSTEACGTLCRSLRYIVGLGIRLHEDRICPRCGAGRRGHGYVYAIQAGGPDGPVKIGFSRDPWKRRKQLQTGSSERLCLLAVATNCTPEDERAFQRLAGSAFLGEWFDWTPRAREVVELISVDGAEVEEWSCPRS